MTQERAVARQMSTGPAGFDIDDRGRHVRAVLREGYGLEVREVVRVCRGMGTRNWRASTSAGEVFVKEFGQVGDAGEIEDALRVADYVRVRGVVTPAIRRTRDGGLFWSDGRVAVAVFEFVAGAVSGGSLGAEQMTAAGRVLGRLHRELVGFAARFEDQTPAWMQFDVDAKLREIDGYLRRIGAAGQRDGFDVVACETLSRRREMVRRIPELLRGLPALRRQVLHGDYSTLNLLFRGDDLVGVVDFGSSRSFLVAYELGRIALSAENLKEADWLSKGLLLVAAYCQANAVPLADVQYAPRIWLIQLIRSTYGVKQHYCGPVEFQRELDEYWSARCEAANILWAHLAEVERAFVDAWKDANQMCGE